MKTIQYSFQTVPLPLIKESFQMPQRMLLLCCQVYLAHARAMSHQKQLNGSKENQNSAVGK